MDYIIENLTSRLNSEVIFVTFKVDSNEDLSFTANYFAYSICCKIIFSKAFNYDELKSISSFTVSIQKDAYSEKTGSIIIDVFPVKQFQDFSSVTAYLNSFIKLLPFRIVKHSAKQYQLLDPEVMDYIGDYVTFIDAKKTCDYNFERNNLK